MAVSRSITSSLSLKPLLQLSYAGRLSSPNRTMACTLPNALNFGRRLHSTPIRSEFHFDTHHFVQRLEREGLNRAQAEGIMSAMAEVIDESIRNMTSNMVTKADQEKVYISILLVLKNHAERDYIL